MSKEICISSTPHETRLAIVENDQLTEIYYERENEYTLAGSIYKGRVTRVLPGMQSAFVDIGLERDAFLYVTDFLEEQEDSADFERSPADVQGGTSTAKAANGRAAEERPRQVEAAAVRAETPEPVSSRPEPARTDERGGEAAADAPEGTRRWRGRRGRRGRALRGRGVEAAAPNASAPSAEDASRDLPEREAPRNGGAHRENHREARPAHNGAAVSQPDSPADVLPGESLSKYGQHNQAASGSPAHSREDSGEFRKPPVVHSRPSTLIEAPVEWSGSGLLPGESRAGESRASAPLEQPPEPSLDLEKDASASHRADPAAPSELRFFSRSSHRGKRDSHPESPAAVPSEPAGGETPQPEPRAAAIHDNLSEAPSGTNEASGNGRGDESEAHFEAHFESRFETHFDERFDNSGDAAASGLLEEEEISGEEEYDFSSTPAGAEEHEFEDMEEETLDPESAPGAQVGDLVGDLVREAHLDERVEASSSAVDVEPANGTEETEAGEPGSDIAESETGALTQRAPRDRRGVRRTDRAARRDTRHRHNGRRQSAQTSDLPIISELLKQGQEILVQIAKEPIAKKGARITSHIALPGRFLVFMPTINHIGVSRKISSDQERQRLKRILLSEKGAGGGFIVRTAADGASEEDLRADIRFLMNLWAEIRQREESAKSPALIYHDLNLVERILRDRVSDDVAAIWVDSEADYERIVRFLNRFQPSLVRRVKLYTKETPLFEQFGIQEEIGKALKSKVWLKSGGSIVINQTEALVAIDVNTGKYVGKTARLEDTILKTNLDAIPEIVRQIRLRDLGGIIVIDFIDMDERRNRHRVMQALEDALKADRAPSKVLQFNDFGLVAITRKRVKQSLERTLCVPCETCGGTGMVKGPVTVTNEIYIEMRKMQHSLDRQDILLRVHPEVVKTLKADNGRWLTEIEEMSGKTILVKSDPSLSPEQFDIH